MTKSEARIVEQLREAHTALLRDLRKLDEASQSPSGTGATKLASRLSATRRHIVEHFRFEEQNGYMDSARKREPRLERTIQQLAAEHREIADSLDALIEQVKATGGPEDGLRKNVQAWVERVRQHETRENKVMQDAFNQDIGAED